jgi:tubulin polyglutamylase TTLL6/13
MPIDRFRVVTDHNLDNWDIFWADSGMTPDFLSSLSNCQRVNHFLGMYNICRKSTLGMHLNRFQKEYPDHYKFFPQTWMYPAEFHDIQEYAKKKAEKRKEIVEMGKMTEQ